MDMNLALREAAEKSGVQAKAGLPDQLDHPDQQKCKPKKEWAIMVTAC